MHDFCVPFVAQERASDGVIALENKILPSLRKSYVWKNGGTSSLPSLCPNEIVSSWDRFGHAAVLSVRQTVVIFDQDFPSTGTHKSIWGAFLVLCKVSHLGARYE